MQPPPQALQSVSIRPATPRDADALVAMLERCSPESRYARFLAPVVRFPPGHLHDVLHIDGTRWSWVASDVRTARVVALVSLFRSRPAPGPASGEVGLLVEDDQHRRGIGAALLQVVAASACDMGIGTLSAVSLTTSRHVRQMLERVGTVTSRTDGHTSEHIVEICTRAARRIPA